MMFLDPVATHGPRADHNGDCIPCAGLREAYVPDIWDRVELSRADPPRKYAVRGPDIVLGGGNDPSKHTARRHRPPTWGEIDACAEKLGSFTLPELRQAMTCSQNAVYLWKKARAELGMVKRLRVGLYTYAVAA